MLEPGKKLELPAYLAKALVLESHASIFVPRCYGDRARESMRADPEVLNLREKNEHFFMHGMCVVELLQDEDVSETLRGTLLDTFVRRYRRILDTSLTGADSDPTGLTHRLSMTEAKRVRSRRALRRAPEPSPATLTRRLLRSRRTARRPLRAQSFSSGTLQLVTTTGGRRGKRAGSLRARSFGCHPSG